MNEHLHFGHGHHMRDALSIKGLRREINKAEGFNAKIAVMITGWVSTMWCAYAFGLLALMSLPAILTQAFHLHAFPHWMVSASLIALVAWVSSYFLQLVLLSVLSVQQAVEGTKSAAAQKHLANQVDLAVDRLDTKTQGGITAIMDRLNEVEMNITIKIDPQSVWNSVRSQKLTAQDILDAKRKDIPGSDENPELYFN